MLKLLLLLAVAAGGALIIPGSVPAWTSAAAMLADATSDPAVGHAVYHGISTGGLITGAVTYAVSMFGLTAWEKHVLPKYMAPDHYKKMTGWDHPTLRESPNVGLLTADLPFGLPSLEEVENACIHIGAEPAAGNRGPTALYMCAATDDESDKIVNDEYVWCELNTEFSEHYGVDITVCRKQVR